MNNYDRDIGRLEAVAHSLERQIAEIKVERDEFRKEVKRLNDEITEIKDLVSQIKGGSRVLMWLGWLVSSGVGAALVKFGPMILVK
jgi:chromosome segregation ATPase